jgi:gliding motility-associated-like protein
MLRVSILLIMFFLQKNIIAQQFQNSDLNGIVSGIGVLPTNWAVVPFNDPNCLATTVLGASPDLTDLNGPLVTNGINGNPYSGNTFVSGMDVLGTTIYHEGIMQTVTGFSIGCSYSINFQQAVVKQNNLLDNSGSWAVYVDNSLLGVTIASTSLALPGSNAFNWDFRTINFTATNNTHTIKFLPNDDDPNKTSTQGLRMGIDSIYLSTNNTQISQNILGNDTIICAGNNLTLNATTTNATYLWSNNTTNSTLNINQSGIYWVQIITGCNVVIDTINVTISSLPNINLGNDTTICSGNTLTLNASTPSSTYLWSNNNISSFINVNQTGSYWVEVNLNGCKQRDTINVTISSLPNINLGNDTTICSGNTLILNASTPSATYLWSNNNTSSNINVNQTGSYWVEVNLNGCKQKDTINVTISSLPNINLGNDTTICSGNTLTLNASTPSATYLWSNNNTSSFINVNQTGSYWVEVNVNGCKHSDTINVSFSTLPVINLGNDTILCEGESIILNATIPNVTYLWSNNTTNSTLIVNQTGNYWVIVNNSNCFYTDNIYVQFTPKPIIKLGNDKVICLGNSIELIANTNASKLLWSTNATSQKIEVSNEGMYWLKATENNCFSYDTINVSFSNYGCNCEVIVPTAFSPNNDFLNDEFRLLNIHNIELQSFKIYNRWGNKVFENQNSLDISWDGKYLGNMCNVGTYYYLVTYKCLKSNIQKTIKGEVTLIR